MEIKINELNTKYTEEALSLFFDSYNRIREELPFLPSPDRYKENYKKNVQHLFQNGSGVIALQHNKLIGFLIGYEIDELFGRNKGIYVPLYGHGTVNNDKKLYQKLYTQAADLWVKRNFFTQAITIFNCDRNVINTFFWLEFGLRCIDAVRKVELIKNDNKNKNIKIIKAELADIELMDDLFNKDNLYYGNSPLFMPVEKNSDIDELKEWLKKDNHHLWMALNKEIVIGYIRIEPTGETVISEYSKMMNITGAFVDEEFRNREIGKQLLNEVLKYLKDKNYKLCGVDFESFNFSGSNFWNKYFKPYTKSLVRHIEK